MRKDDSSWYSVFREAILEPKRDKVLPQIDRARNAIWIRLSELQSGPPDNQREPSDLSDALHYLAILSQHVGQETGKILWE